MVHTGNFDFEFGSEAIAVVNEYTYQCITFNCNDRFRRGELELVEQAKRAIYSIVVTCRKLVLPVDIQIDMYNSMVVPIVTYASEIWGHYVMREIKLMQTRFHKHVLFVHRNTSNDITYGELAVYLIDIRIKCRAIVFWLRLINGKNTKLCHLMHKCF